MGREERGRCGKGSIEREFGAMEKIANVDHRRAVWGKKQDKKSRDIQ
jgi:hypothetical protein